MEQFGDPLNVEGVQEGMELEERQGQAFVVIDTVESPRALREIGDLEHGSNSG